MSSQADRALHISLIAQLIMTTVTTGVEAHLHAPSAHVYVRARSLHRANGYVLQKHDHESANEQQENCSRSPSCQ